MENPWKFSGNSMENWWNLRIPNGSRVSISPCYPHARTEFTFSSQTCWGWNGGRKNLVTKVDPKYIKCWGVWIKKYENFNRIRRRLICFMQNNKVTFIYRPTNCTKSAMLKINGAWPWPIDSVLNLVCLRGSCRPANCKSAHYQMDLHR